MRSRPADRGLTHLGIAMEALGWLQLAGTLWFLAFLFATTSDGGPPDARIDSLDDRLLVAAVVQGIGAVALTFAGRGLANASTRAAKVYVVVGGITSVLFVAALSGWHLSINLLLVAAIALAQPIVIAFALRSAPRREDALDPGRFVPPEDGGSSGLRTLMIMVATIELAGAAAVGWFLPESRSIPFALALAVRGSLQLVAGCSLPIRFVALTRAYVVVGLISAPLVAVVVFGKFGVMGLWGGATRGWACGVALCHLSCAGTGLGVGSSLGVVGRCRTRGGRMGLADVLRSSVGSVDPESTSPRSDRVTSTRGPPGRQRSGWGRGSACN